MSATLSKKFNGKKYMWDGMAYENSDQAFAAAEAYQKNGFETESVVEEQQVFIYTRRVAAAQSGN
jgi:hypothetical protein